MSATFEIFECVLPQLIKNMRSGFFNFLNTRASIPANHLKVARSKNLREYLHEKKKLRKSARKKKKPRKSSHKKKKVREIFQQEIKGM